MKKIYTLLSILFFSSILLGQQPNSTPDVQILSQKIDHLEQLISNDNDNNTFLFGLLTTSLTLLTFLFGIYQYSSKKDEDFKKTIWEERKNLFMEVLEHTASIAIAKNIDAEKTKKHREAFWTLYWGRLSLMEDKQVLLALIDYGDVLESVEQHKVAIQDSDLENWSHLLAEACRNSLIQTWQPVKFQKLGHIARHASKNEKIQDAEDEENQRINEK